ncbi:hypothetical protein [Eubacterium ventriosum]|uniref:hypothetical protein n=1 Tax=Eubacterium ventriosum TaxID=39496 RepID=UPI0039949A2C
MVFLYPKTRKDKYVQGRITGTDYKMQEMQSKCRIDDIDSFIRLSNRIEELTGKIDKTEKQLVVPVQRRETLEVEMF